MQPPLEGLIPAPFTPFGRDFALALDRVEQLAEHYVQHEAAAVFVGGTTGECHSLTVDERMALARRWVEAARGSGLKVIVQVGHNCQADARTLAEHAQRVGADAVAAMAPTFFKPASARELADFCVPIAAAADETPFFFYEIPMMTGVRVSMPDFLVEAKTWIPNFAGLKYTNQDLVQFQECVEVAGGEFDLLFGCDEILLAGLTLGARAAVGSTYNFAAGHYHGIIEAFQAGRRETARQEQARSVNLIRTLQRYGFFAAAKCVMAMIGLDCGPVRPPLANLDAARQHELREGLAALDLLDAPLASGHSAAS